MVAVGRPVLAGFWRNDHDGIDEAVELSHDLLQTFHVRRRQIPLEWGGLHTVHGEQAQQVPVIADGLAEYGEDVAAVALHLLGQRADVARRFLVGEGRPGRHRRVLRAGGDDSWERMLV